MGTVTVRMSFERVSAVGTVTVRMSFERERVLWVQ